MLAVIKTGGKQYLVSPEKKLKIEKIVPNEKGEVTFDKVLLVADGEKVKVGKPYIEGATVVGRVAKEGRTKKIIVFKYKAKKRYKKKAGHRQHYTEVLISEIKTSVNSK